MTEPARDTRANTQPRRGLRRVEAAIYVGVSPTKFDELVGDGRMPRPIAIDGVTVWDLVQLDQAFEALAGSGEKVNPWDQTKWNREHRKE
jgi:hypothetical protein